MAFKFEKLIVWQKAVDLSYNINELTKSFPKEELFILSAQIKRAADSVSLISQKVQPVNQIRSLINSWVMHSDQILKWLDVYILLKDEN